MPGTLLKYSIDPTKAYIALQTNLVLTLENPRDEPVRFLFGRRGSQVLVTFPAPPNYQGADALTNVVDFGAESSMKQRFTAGIQSEGSNTFVIAAVETDQVLQRGESFQITFGPITVNGVDGKPVIAIEEYITDDPAETSVSVEKLKKELSIIAWLNPWIVGLGKSSTLYWQSFGGTEVEISGFPTGTGKKSFPVEGDPPYPGRTAVTVPANESARPYTAEVFSAGDHRQVQLTLLQNPAFITRFQIQPPVPPGPINPTISASLIWGTLYAFKVYLLNPQGQANPKPPNPFSPEVVWPGRDALASAPDYRQIPPEAVYTLEATGYQKPDTRSISFQLSKIQLLYFKYLVMGADGKLSGVSYQTDGDWRAVQMVVAEDLNVLTVFQPGGTTSVYYLGSGDKTHPQIQYFAATKAESGFTLRWVTANLVSLVLGPEEYQVPADRIANGTYDVNPSSATTYVLKGTTADGQTITSTLMVKP